MAGSSERTRTFPTSRRSSLLGNGGFCLPPTCQQSPAFACCAAVLDLGLGVTKTQEIDELFGLCPNIQGGHSIAHVGGRSSATVTEGLEYRREACARRLPRR